VDPDLLSIGGKVHVCNVVTLIYFQNNVVRIDGELRPGRRVPYSSEIKIFKDDLVARLSRLAFPKKSRAAGKSPDNSNIQ
jgi:hypothetical protein